MYKEIVAERLKKARHDTGFSQNEVAKETGIMSSKIAKIELGTQNPDCETLGILADFYEVSVDWLLGTKGGAKAIDGKKAEIEYYRNAK